MKKMQEQLKIVLLKLQAMKKNKMLTKYKKIGL